MLINDRPAKILILGEAQVTHTQRWVSYFRGQGWTVRALSFPPIPTGIAIESLGTSILPRALHVMQSASRVRRILSEFRPDITSALFVPDYGWLAALAGAKPLVVSAWGSDVLIAPQKSPFHRRRVRAILRRADHIFADAETLRRPMSALGASPERVSIIPLGVEDALLEIGAERTIKQNSPLTVFHNRRLEPLYRVDTLVLADGAITAQGNADRFQFVIAGSGTLRSTLERLGTQSALNNVAFKDWMSATDLAKQIGASDIYVSCAESDATSVSLLEAMAAGCYPIVTDLPANREWITHNGNGMLYPVGDHRALAHAILLAAGDPDARERARVANQEIIRSRARWRDNMATVESVMAGVMRQKLP